MFAALAVLPTWLKKWAISYAIKKFLAWLNALFSSRAAREVEKREEQQKANDARPPSPDTVDSRLSGGSA
jgi:hypothetical protein